MKNLNFIPESYFEVKRIANNKLKPVLIVFVVCSFILISFIFYFSFYDINELLADSLELLIIPIIIGLLYFTYKFYLKAGFDFWYNFAEKNNGSYAPFANYLDEKSIMFKEGRDRIIEHVVKLENTFGESMRIFTYSFKLTNMENSSRRYTVFNFKFDGNVPNIYLNYKHNLFGIKTYNEIPLPREFEKYYRLSSAPQYEVEALEIFTPDIMVNILDIGFFTDIELIDNEIYFFIEMTRQNEIDKLGENYEYIMKIMKLLNPKIDKFSFEKIGNFSPKI